MKQCRYRFLRTCANAIPDFWMGTMPPRITVPVMIGVDARLHQSHDLIFAAGASSAQDRDNFRLQAPLPTTMGGFNVGGHEEACGPKFASVLLACCPTLQRTCVHLAGVSLANGTLAPAARAPGGQRRPRRTCS